MSASLLSWQVAVVIWSTMAALVMSEKLWETGEWNDPDIVYVKEESRWVKHPGAFAPGEMRPAIVLPDGTRHYNVSSAGTIFGQHTPPPINVDQDWAVEHASITVLVASFRETRCPQTLKSMFTKAKFSSRIYFGVIQQNEDSDTDCLQGYCELMGTPVTDAQLKAGDSGGCKLFNQVRMVRMAASEAKGPVFARSRQIETVYDEDDFCMQIDAHTDVVPDWDVSMVKEWLSTQNEFAVLTTYPTNVDHIGKNVNKHWEMPHLCKASFSGKGRIHNEQALAAANLQYPLLSPLWAAGLSFARCHAERNVPTDPVLKSTFTGEEYSRGSRLWTAGYDFYSITRPIIGTYYGGQKGGKGSFKHDQMEFQIANERMATLLQWPGSDQSEEAIKKLGQYGLGNKRTLAQYAEFSGVDTIHQVSHGRCVVQYVPWDWAHPMIPEIGHDAYAHERKKVNPPPGNKIKQIDTAAAVEVAQMSVRKETEQVIVGRPARQQVPDEAEVKVGSEDDDVESEGSHGWNASELILTIVVFYAGMTISGYLAESKKQQSITKSRHLIA